MSTKPARTWLVPALALSLAANLFLVGVLGGRAWSARHGVLLRGDGELTMLARYEALPAPDRARFRAAMAPHGVEMRAAEQALHAAQRRTLATLAADPYDRGAMLSAFAAQRAALAARQAAVQTAMADALATLAPDARADLAGRR